MFAILFVILEIQQFLPLNPDGQGSVDPGWHSIPRLSFITNTNWQNYGGESTLSYFSQMFAIIFPQFTSAATGLACGIAFIRGLGGKVGAGQLLRRPDAGDHPHHAADRVRRGAGLRRAGRPGHVCRRAHRSTP